MRSLCWWRPRLRPQKSTNGAVPISPRPASAKGRVRAAHSKGGGGGGGGLGPECGRAGPAEPRGEVYAHAGWGDGGLREGGPRRGPSTAASRLGQRSRRRLSGRARGDVPRVAIAAASRRAARREAAAASSGKSPSSADPPPPLPASAVSWAPAGPILAERCGKISWLEGALRLTAAAPNRALRNLSSSCGGACPESLSAGTARDRVWRLFRRSSFLLGCGPVESAAEVCSLRARLSHRAFMEVTVQWCKRMLGLASAIYRIDNHHKSHRDLFWLRFP